MSSKELHRSNLEERLRSEPFPREEHIVFGSNVERLRTDEGLSMTRFCQMADISRPTLYAIESGEGDPHLSVMVKIARALGVRLEDLLNPRWWEYK